MKNIDTVILIPAYNPTNDLIPLTSNLLKEGFRIVVVNDGSNSNTLKIFKKLDKQIKILKHKVNMGKGQALKTGFSYILKNIKCNGVITADADGQHILEDILKINNELKTSSDTLILGSRKQNNEMLLKSRVGNTITRFIFKLVTKTTIYDTQSGLRGIPYKYLNDFLKIDGARYEYEINMLLYCANKKIKITEIPINIIYIDNNKASSFKVVKDSIKIYKCILKDSNISRIILFTISALLSFAIDFILLFLLNKFTPFCENKDLNLFICVILARAISSIFNFIFNRNIVFKSQNSIVLSLLKYYILTLSMLFINYILLDMLFVKLTINLAISKIIVELLLFIINYIIQKIHIFKK